MNTKPPTLRRHKTGQWMVRWGGRDRYFGLDREKAEATFLSDKHDGLPGWTVWRAERNTRTLPPLRSALTVEELRRRFIENRTGEGGPERAQFYKWALKHFIATYGHWRADAIRAIVIQDLKDVLLAKGLGPKTINHVIQAIRTMFQWAMDLELIPPVNLRGVKKLPLPPFVDRSWSKAKVRRFVNGCQDDQLRAWLSVNYLTAMRPKEVVRAVTGEGHWARKGVLIIPNKARNASRMPRHVLFSDEALAWFGKCEPRWTRLDSYSQATRLERRTGPHPLRHSAATHLLASGVARDDVDQILGHYPRATSLTYMQPRFANLRKLIRRLSLK